MIYKFEVEKPITNCELCPCLTWDEPRSCGFDETIKVSFTEIPKGCKLQKVETSQDLLEWVQLGIKHEKERIEERSISAAYNGGWDHVDKTALRMLESFLAGLRQEILEDFKQDYLAWCQEEKVKNDPEFKEYMRLKNKFGR